MIRRNLSTEASREFWRDADRVAAEVRTWPDWKRAGINVTDRRTEMKRPNARSRPRHAWTYPHDGPAIRRCVKCGLETTVGQNIGRRRAGLNGGQWWRHMTADWQPGKIFQACVDASKKTEILR